MRNFAMIWTMVLGCILGFNVHLALHGANPAVGWICAGGVFGAMLVTLDTMRRT